MKKRTIISLIVAAALILGGGILAAFGFYMAGEEAFVPSLTEREVPVREAFESVVIETEDCEVNFTPFNGDADPYIVFMEREKVSHHTSVQGGVLKVNMTDQRQWMDHIGFIGGSMKITVYLPLKQYESLRVTTDTGDIKVPEVLSSKEIWLSSDTGDILCEAAAKSLVDCATDTGDITVKNCAPATLRLQTDTGDVKLRMIGGTEIHLETDTGNVDAEDVYCSVFSCESDTGDVQIKDGDANLINIKTNTGDVYMPKAWQKKNCHIESDTGNIRFE